MKKKKMFVLVYCVVIFQVFNLNFAEIENDILLSNPSLVKTANGMVRGVMEKTIDKKRPFIAFRGIPYASPPIKDLRFRPPQPAKNWDGIKDASRDGNYCVQSSKRLNYGNEDCLFINVYLPKLKRDGNLLPVLVWIHGGAFVMGDSSYSSYGPDYFLNEDVIFVSFNYRLGIFGFLSTEDLASPGNYGLKDQILALRWIQDNIRAFDGNPNEVTIFGESAGAATVSYLAQSPLTTGLYKRAILNSGSTLCQWALNRNPRRITEIIAKSFGIATSNSNEMIDRLRRVDYQQLFFKTFHLALNENNDFLHGLPFSPTIEPEHDGAVLSGNSHELLDNHNYNNVSYLMGFNSKEADGATKKIHSFFFDLLTPYDSNITRLIPIDMNVRRSDVEMVALEIKQRYFARNENITSNMSKVETFISDDQFVRPIRETVRLYSRDVPVYYYRFSYMGNLSSSGLFKKHKTEGVHHALDMKYLFRDDDLLKNDGTEALRTRYRLVRLWSNFVKYGNPTPTDDDLLQNVNWPMARTPNSDDETLRYLDIGENLVVKSNPRHEYITFWQNLYRYYGRPPYDTY